MSKSNLRKITVETTKCNIDSRRPSVFERLGTKPAIATNPPNTSDFCRNWAVNGSCSYGKSCKYANTHTLISPSKRAKKDNATANAPLLNEDPFKRLTSKLVKKASHSPDLNLEEWNQTDLEYEDEKVLERRRQLIQRELEIQMKKDKEVHGKDKTKFKKKVMSSSSSSRSSSSSSSTSSSSSDDSSSTSTSDSRKKVKKLKKVKHHSASPDYGDDKDRKKKLKLKRLGQKNEKLALKKKRKVDLSSKKEEKTTKKTNPVPVRKHSDLRSKSPVTMPQNNSKSKEKNKSESPKPKAKEPEKEKHHKKVREEETVVKEVPKVKIVEKPKELEKSKTRPTEEKNKIDDKAKRRSKEREKRSRTPPVDRSKHSKDTSSTKSKRSRTPEKPVKAKQDHTPSKHQDKRSTSSRSRELDKKDRETHKRERSKEREEPRKNDQGKSRPSSSQEDSHRKNTGKDFEEKNYPRQRSKERREKDHVRNDHRDTRVNRDQRDQRDKDREEPQDRRDRQRDRERDKEVTKVREREIPSLMATTALNPMDKAQRYRRSKDRMKDCSIEKGNIRDRRGERDKDRNDPKLVERDRSSQRYDGRFDRPGDKDLPVHKIVDRERIDRFPRDRSIDRIGEKNVQVRDHMLDRDQMYERDRHRRFNPRFERGHPEHERKDQHLPAIKIDRRDSPRGNIEIDRNFDRNYSRLPPEHWNEDEEQGSHMDYRDHHPHEDDRRKGVESRRYSPFNERRGRDDRGQRYGMQGDRQFDDIHHPVYSGDKIRPGGGIRDESSNDNWDAHHDIEHGVRDRNYQGNDWEEREWRGGAGGRGMWERESLPRSDAHEEEWSSRYDSPMSDWKMNDSRKWDNQPMHIRGSYRNDRMKDMDTGENHGKRRSYNTPEIRDEIPAHVSKQGALHNSMKDEPINKKLMELAEGRPRRSREKSADSFQKKLPPKEKVEVKETPVPEVKRPNLEESLQTLHTESDLSDISDDPDDILNMDDEVIEKVSKKIAEPVDQDTSSNQNQDIPQPSTKQATESTVFSKEKDTSEAIAFSNKNIEDESMETMDFEEISDGELEEDIKTSGKGLGDALGVDWASLVNESQPRRSHNQDVTQNRWQCKAVFQRIGISVKTAGNELVEKFIKKYGDSENGKFFMDDVALMHTALMRKHLFDNSTYGLLSNEDLLYSSKCEKKEDNPEDLKPCTSLYEEAKLLLEQAA